MCVNVIDYSGSVHVGAVVSRVVPAWFCILPQVQTKSALSWHLAATLILVGVVVLRPLQISKPMIEADMRRRNRCVGGGCVMRRGAREGVWGGNYRHKKDLEKLYALLNIFRLYTHPRSAGIIFLVQKPACHFP